MGILKIYTDGACSGNQCDNNIGGWGAILKFGVAEKELWGGLVNTTNNRMEMSALLNAFKAINKPNQTIEVYSDSSYLMNCFRDKWYVKWQKNGWKNSKKEPVENQDLWQELLPFLEQHSITFFRVKGHVNLASPQTNAQAHYQKFLKDNDVVWNASAPGGTSAPTKPTFAEFAFIIEMNNRADALANRGIDELR